MLRFFTPVLILIALLTLIGCRGVGATPTPPPPTATSPISPTTAPESTPTSEPSEPTAALEATATAVPEPVDIIETLGARDEFSTLLAALEGQGLIEKFTSAGPFTLFAPTDAAFDALPEDELEDEDILFDTLLYHAIAGELSAQELATLDMVTTMLGDELAISAEDNGLRLGDEAVGYATVGEQAIKATNGVIYIIDHVLIPESAGQP